MTSTSPQPATNAPVAPAADATHLKDGFAERILPGDEASRGDIVAHVQRYRFAAQYAAGRKVLDAGCGVGYGSRLLADSDAASVLAIDISDDALGVARSRFAHPRVEYLKANCETMDGVRGPFDVVVALESLEHFQDGRRFLRSVVSVLASDGTLVCSTPNGAGVGHDPSNPHHTVEYSFQEFEHLLREFFDEVTVRGQQWSAATRAINILWTNPLMRVGRWLQKVLRGRQLDDYLWSRQAVLTEADLVISDLNVDISWTLIAVCRGPKK